VFLCAFAALREDSFGSHAKTQRRKGRENHKRPFVDGSWSFNRASLEQAYFMARAKHLKMASSLWWLERP
jgi:hypothetical protein